jgi:hypothetical protein
VPDLKRIVALVRLQDRASSHHPPGWERMASWIYAIGFGLATVLGVLIAWSIMRPKDR